LSEPGTPPARILVVDDQRTHREKLVRAARALGHDAESVDGGASALARLAAEPFDLVLLDILMPDMDGFEVMRFMQRDRKLADIPVIVVSALESEMDSVVRAVEMGAEDMLPKHFDRVLLAARLDSALERHRVRTREREHREHMHRLTDAASLMQHHPELPPGPLLLKTCARDDAIGRLARVFAHMSGEVHAREVRLRRQLVLLRLAGLVLAAGAILGLAPPLARITLLAQPHPLGIALWLAVICALLCLPAALWRHGPVRRQAGLMRLVATLTLCGALAGTLPVLWLSGSLPAAVLATLFPAELAFALALSPLLNARWPSPSRLLAAGLALAAVCTLAAGLPGLPRWSAHTLALALVAPFGWALCGRALACNAARDGAARIDALAAVGLSALLASVCLAPFTFVLGEFVPLFGAGATDASSSSILDPGGSAAGLVVVLLGAVLSAGATLRVLLAHEGGAEPVAAASLVTAFAALGWSVVILGENVPAALWLPLALFTGALLVRAAVLHRLEDLARAGPQIELG